MSFTDITIASPPVKLRHNLKPQAGYRTRPEKARGPTKQHWGGHKFRAQKFP